ncbi:adenosylcobinamide-GDP ribazoletransferase [Clostridium sp. DJ247]|uniref:adenosylcobinamide-GDP ribazoletransferase n=1 Tax=Clostridium sp. DJ247 TaxID=2726188 RepID=UPI0016253192|nr:adenosylcobinamide-GDP ribazoletransferase [Clostridium sp. DJ247]MBC2579806.1 adenosylcobinamide-GDP ribazoletransferase [Clostridium sp. DJ247]
MKETICNFLLMLQFFTRIPVNINLPCEKHNFRRGSVFLPIIGFIVGIIQWLIYKMLIKVLPVSTSIVLILLVGVIVTGAMHIDGLGDTCDGFFAFKGSGRIIEIMKDSRIGTYACIVIVIDFLLRYTLLVFIVPNFSIAIIVVPIIARLSILFLASVGKSAKSNGTGNFFVGNFGKMQFVIGIVITIGILILIMNPRHVIILTISALALSFLFNFYCNIKINGLTGDTLGANNELVEILTLILIAIMLG